MRSGDVACRMGETSLSCSAERWADAVLYTVKRTTKDGYLLGT